MKEHLCQVPGCLSLTNVEHLLGFRGTQDTTEVFGNICDALVPASKMQT